MFQRQSQKEEIALEARRLLKQGDKTKQEVFEILVDKYKYAKDVSDVLKYIPTLHTNTKYGMWNTLLLIFIVLTIPFLIIAGIPPVGALFLYYGLLVYIVATKKIRYYAGVTVMSSCMMLIFIIAFFTTPEIVFYWKILTILILIPCCFLPIWLQKKLCPKPTEKKEIYTNSNGEQRMRVVYEFSE